MPGSDDMWVDPGISEGEDPAPRAVPLIGVMLGAVAFVGLSFAAWLLAAVPCGAQITAPAGTECARSADSRQLALLFILLIPFGAAASYFSQKWRYFGIALLLAAALLLWAGSESWQSISHD